jgi:chaperone modulatory protein CbpM
MLEIREFLLRARLDAAALEAWVEAGWLVPRQAEPGRAFSELDLARACLIRDLREAMGVNDEGIEVVLDLLDQVHGLRHALQRVSAALQALPAPLRQEVLVRLQPGPEAAGSRAGEGAPATG